MQCMQIQKCSGNQQRFSNSVGDSCKAQRWILSCLIKIWLSHLPRSNVISVTRMGEEERSKEADNGPVPLPQLSSRTTYCVTNLILGQRLFNKQHVVISHNWKLLQNVPVIALKEKNKAELWGLSCFYWVWQAERREQDPEPTVCHIYSHMTSWLPDTRGPSIRARRTQLRYSRHRAQFKLPCRLKAAVDVIVVILKHELYKHNYILFFK